jgi:hypothetical protein
VEKKIDETITKILVIHPKLNFWLIFDI